eukprot:COSAG06_NODE_49075_length_327_cov_230.921053_1_plen_75_part_10
MCDAAATLRACTAFMPTANSSTLDRCAGQSHTGHYWARISTALYCIVLEGNRENCSVSAPRRPSVQADPQGMQPG